jgi:DNA mismatch repair protein MutL
MPSKIRVLSDLTINQIAAGEVIENPASVIKELVENSLDAKATHIRIEIQAGGHLSLSVSDNGIGMDKNDAFLAFERHATSKIAQFGDLFSLTSMGFRGEALASIAAVSKVVLETAEEGSLGTRVECVGGKILSSTGFPRSRGTTIEVRSLFFNVPARKKFQKGAAASTQEIVKMITRISLAHREVTFILVSQDKILFQAQSSQDKRAEEILGAAFLDNASSFSIEEREYKLTAFFGSPKEARSTRLGQYLLINRRSIQSPFLSRVMKEAYGSRIASDAHPSFVIWLEVPPHHIDVNVHPQKREVRFKEEEFLEKFLHKALQEALKPKGEMLFSSLPILQKTAFIRKMEKPLELSLFADNPKEEEKEEESLFPRLTFLTFLGRGVLYRTDKGQILFVDLRGLYAKKVYEEVKERLEGEKEAPLQTLLFPITLTFSKEEMALLEKSLAIFLRMGMRLIPFGKNAMLVDAIAETISLEGVKEILESFLETMKGGVDIEKCAYLSALQARKKSYTREEANLLAEELFKREDTILSITGKRIFRLLDEDRVVEMLCED